jgi:hypothetical protein
LASSLCPMKSSLGSIPVMESLLVAPAAYAPAGQPEPSASEVEVESGLPVRGQPSPAAARSRLSFPGLARVVEPGHPPGPGLTLETLGSDPAGLRFIPRRLDDAPRHHLSPRGLAGRSTSGSGLVRASAQSPLDAAESGGSRECPVGRPRVSRAKWAAVAGVDLGRAKAEPNPGSSSSWSECPSPGQRRAAPARVAPVPLLLRFAGTG